jgi:acetyl-CoA synthetase
MTPEKGMVSMMHEKRVFPPSPEVRDRAHIQSMEEYRRLYQESLKDPEGFWSRLAEDVEWFKKWDTVMVDDFANARHEWFVGGKLNVAYNCLDRHVKGERRDKVAIVWEGEPEGETITYTYGQLYEEVCRFANVLKKHGVSRGDRVSIYLPMVPELPIAMLACARIGAIHSVVFGGFSAESLRDRIVDAGAKILICCDGYYRNGRIVDSKANADAAMAQCPNLTRAIVVKRIGGETQMQQGRDIWWHDAMAAGDIASECAPEEMDAEDTLFILYTSGSTGKPKGVLHTQAGYLLYTLETFKYVFDYHEEDIFWCTADIGWVTGHSYLVYGPLAAGATTMMFEGVPTYPDPGRFWAIVDKHNVNIFYTAPTVLRALMREGDDWPAKYDLSSLRVLGSVGEPINPEAWMWYYQTIGKERCPIVDTWWQTETGGILITPLPGATSLKPGSAAFPFFGVEPQILREDGRPAEVNEGGYLVIKRPWPGLMREVYGEPDRFRETYFVQFPGVYFSGDGARRDEEGYFWLMGRVDDVLNVSGHRIGTAEVESALVSHGLVTEAAVVGYPHDVKGQGIYAFVTLKAGVEKSEDFKKTLVAHVRKEIGPIASPDKIHFTDALPKTRSGKIMRRILRKIAEGDIENLGDVTTLADPSVVDDLVQGRQ